MNTPTNAHFRHRRGDYRDHIAVRLFAIAAVILLASATTPYAAVVVSEIQSANTSTLADGDSDFPDWIELHNAGSVAAAMLGYGITDDVADPIKWTFPDTTIEPGGYLLVFASDKDTVYPNGEMHTGFKISSSGESLYLTNPDGAVVDYTPATEIPADRSFGRPTGDLQSWWFFTVPTPGTPNVESGYLGFLTAPDLSQPAGFHTGAFPLSISSVDGAIIRYTLDGSVPTEASPAYESSIIVSEQANTSTDLSLIRTVVPGRFWMPPDGPVEKGLVVRARAFRDGFVPSPVVTRTYFVDPLGAERYSLPVISLASDSTHLFSGATGILVPGDGYDGDNWRTSNYAQDGVAWERPTHVEFFDDDGSLGISQDAGIRVHGNFTRNIPNKALRLYARDDYGAKWFEYPLFPGSDVTRFKRLILRTSGNDNGATYFLDAALQRTVRGNGPDIQSARTAVLFINGEYWGIVHIRERFDEYYAATHYNVDRDDVDMLEFIREEPGRGIPAHFEVDAGDTLDHTALLEWFATHDLRNEANLAVAASWIDIANHFEYMIAESYFANTDWPGKNNAFWRARKPFDANAPVGADGRWRWMIKDLDGSFGGRTDSRIDTDMIAWITAPDGGYWNPPRSTVILRSLLENDAERRRFVLTAAHMLNTTLHTDHVVAVIDSFATLIEPEITEHIRRWGRPAAVSDWSAAVNDIRAFAARRNGYMRNNLSENFDLDGWVLITVEMPSTEAVDLDGLIIAGAVPAGSEESDGIRRWTGQYPAGIPLRLAVRSGGVNQFTGWHWRPAATDEWTVVASDTLVLTLSGETQVIAAFAGTPTGIESRPTPPSFTLAQNAPNPFNPVTTIRYAVPTSGTAYLTIYTIAGQRVRTLVAGPVAAGEHAVVWDGSDEARRPAASGVYFYRLTVLSDDASAPSLKRTERSEIRRMTLVR